MSRLIDGFDPEEVLDDIPSEFLQLEPFFFSRRTGFYLKPDVLGLIRISFKLCFNCEEWNDKSSKECDYCSSTDFIACYEIDEQHILKYNTILKRI